MQELETITVFGGNGFVGGRYCELTNNTCKKSRNDYSVDTSGNLVYFISTIDNYNVFDDPYVDINTNLTTLIKVLENCKNKNVVFNFISSWFVYGNVDLPAKENSNCDPKGFYSITKRAAEQLLISYCETFNIKYRILRLANVLGMQDSKVSKKKNALQFMLNELKSGKQIQLYDGGNIFRDYIHVDDVAQAINLIINSSVYNEIINVGNGIPVYLKDIMYFAANKLGCTELIHSMPPADFHNIVQTKNMVLDISKLKSLGYTQKFSVEDTIQQLLKDE